MIGTALTFSLYLKGAQMIGGPKASILSCAEPLSSALLSVILLGVAFTLPDWLGTLLIVSSVVLISMDSRKRVKARRSLLPSPQPSPTGEGEKHYFVFTFLPPAARSAASACRR